MTTYIEGYSVQALPGLLTQRQAEAAVWVAEGKTDDEVGAIMGCTGRTAKKHVLDTMAKLNVHTRAQMVASLFLRGLMSAKALALVLCFSLTASITGGDLQQVYRVRGGARITTRTNRPLQVHGGA